MTTTADTIDAAAGGQVAAWCMSQVGVRWVHQGRSPGLGLDCVGLAICATRAMGLEVRDALTYSLNPVSSELLAVVEEHCARVTDEQLGDLLLFWFRRPSDPVHAGIDIGGGRMVHALRQLPDGRVLVDRHDSGRWSRRLHSRWRLRCPAR